MATWSEADIPDQTGRTVFITGANSGLGLCSAVALAAAGARVLLGCRSATRGRQARDEVAAVARVEPHLVTLDLADLASVRAAADEARSLTTDALDVQINNAGVMAPPRGTTADGFETQFGVNHLGHAALTWLLMPALRGSDSGRVVTVSSLMARGARLDLADPNGRQRRYNPATAYARSKLANQVFALELDRRLRAAGENVRSLAAHPGYSRTGLFSAMSRSQHNPLLRGVMDTGSRLSARMFAQSARMGALPVLYAATAPEADGGEYIGPGGVGGVRGHPVAVRPERAARDPHIGAQLWELTATLTAVTPDPA